MKLNYTYQQTPKIKQLLSEIKILKTSTDIIPQFIPNQKNLQRQSLLKSSVFSARIEGNQLTPSTYQSAKGLEKLEVENIYKSLRWLYSNKSSKLFNLNLILKLHHQVMKNITPANGKLRTESSAVFNQAGIAIYLAPPPDEVPGLINQLIKKVNQSKESAPITAALTHYAFEKIHPFLDGNGRVGRLLSTFILKQARFDFHGLVNLEEYLDENRQEYYDLLNLNKKDITLFVEFFLTGTKKQAIRSINQLKKAPQKSESTLLSPRRQEILNIIKDHQVISFDFIKRRFISIPNSTLHYDIKQLLDKGSIKKLGSTRGALYTTT